VRSRSVPYVVQVSILTALYFGAAKLGFVAAFAQGNVSSIWPPTGLAFAALLLFGPRLWPGIVLGEFLANASTGTPLVSAFGMGVGNTLEALLGVALLHRAGFHRSLDRLQDVLGLTLSALVSPVSSATIGVASLLLGGVIASPAAGSTWLVWWSGDVMGALVVTPVLLIWYSGLPSDLSAPRAAEAGLLLVALAAISQFIFGGRLDYSYILFPCIVWAALRFGQRGAATAILLTSGVAVWDTANGSGPFAQATLYQSLFFVQTFIGTIALTGLTLAAIMAERRRAEDALRASDRSLKQTHDQLAAILENAPAVAIQTYDERGAVTYWNRASEQFYGFSAEQALGKHLGQLILTEAGEQEFEQLVKTLMATGQPVPFYEGVVTTATGQTRHILSSTFPIGAEPEQRQVVCMDIDLTERKRAEEALRKSEELYRTLARNFSNGAVALFDHDLRYTLADGAGLAEIGLSSEGVEGKTLWEIFSPELCALLEPQCRAALAGMPMMIEIPYEDRIYAVHTVPVKNEHGESFAGMVTTQNITEQVRAAQALRRQNTYLTDLHETTLGLMNRLDLADLLETIVERAARLLGTAHGYLYLVEPGDEESELKVGIGRFQQKVGLRLRRGEGLVGKVWQSDQTLVINEYDEWPGRTPGLPYGIYHAVIGTPLKLGALVVGVLGLAYTERGQRFGENEIALLNGFAQLAAIAYDNALLYAKAQQELNAHTQALAALRDSEELYRLITENTRDLIALLDQEGRCVYTSPSYSSILGYAPVVLIGRAMATFIHQEDLALVTEQLAWLATTGAAQTTFRAQHANGSWRWIETFWTATVQQGSHHTLAVGRDITERRRLETQFLQAQKMESIGRLAGGVAHDFNNLLTAILSYTDLARETLAPDHSVQADLDEVAGAARRAAELTRQLLAFARKQVIEPQVFGINELIGGLDRLLRRLIGEDIELIVQLAANLGQVRADPGQIEQVLVNLAVNARDAMPNGGKLIVETDNVTFEEFTAAQQDDIAPGEYVLIEVSDTGVGMDTETQRRIFEPFFTTKGPGQGTGLGLATCYGIVKQHGGYIVVYSEAGLGSTFKIYLPQTAGQITAVAQRAAPAAVPGGGETILLAEDEPAVRALAGRVLRERGYTVIEASNGDEALHVAEVRNRSAIDLLLTDMVMPQMGGAALAEHLKELYPGLRVLFISGYTDSALIQHGRMGSVMELLHKPFSPGDLARKVRELLDS
jgi:two-component system cell cycle sensor histidine kinase/response regulator CckA